MIFSSKKRVEEDLERIRFANLSPEKQEKELSEIARRKKEVNAIQYEKNDRLAMIIAVYSIVLPYVLAFIVGLGIFIGLLYMFFLR